MFNKIYTLSAVFTFFVFSFTLCNQILAPAYAADANDAFKDNMRKVLKENPDLVLDVLRENSEMVLEIAQQGSEQRRLKAFVAQWQKDLTEPKKIDVTNRPMRGNVDATVTIVAFSDFTCTYCQQAESTIAKIMDAYKGKVRFTYKSLPVEGRTGSKESAEMVMAAFEQDAQKAWVLYDAFFANRARISAEGDSYLKSAAKEAGLNMQRLQADMKSKKIQAILAADKAEAETLTVQGTPYFFINDIAVRGALPEAMFTEALDMAIAADNAKKNKK